MRKNIDLSFLKCIIIKIKYFIVKLSFLLFILLTMIRLVKDLFSPKNEDYFKRDYFFSFQNEKKDTTII